MTNEKGKHCSKPLNAKPKNGHLKKRGKWMTKILVLNSRKKGVEEMAPPRSLSHHAN